MGPRNRIPSRGAKGIKRGAKRRAVERPPMDEGLPPHEEEVQEPAVPDIPEDVGTSGVGPSQAKECVTQDVVAGNIRPRRHRRTTNRYTPG